MDREAVAGIAGDLAGGRGGFESDRGEKGGWFCRSVGGGCAERGSVYLERDSGCVAIFGREVGAGTCVGELCECECGI